MPRKSSQSHNNTQEQQPNSLTPDDVDIKRIHFKARVPDKSATQQMCYPKYLYGDLKPTPNNLENKGQQFLLVTDEIKMTRGGIPRHNERYHGPDPDSNKRGWFYLPYDPSNENSVKLFNAIRKIDDYMDKEINEKKNSNDILCYDKKGKRAKFKGLTYKRMITTARGPKTLDLDDDDDDNTDKKKFIPYDRIKVKLSTVYNPELGQNDTREINTHVYLKDNEEPEQTSTVTDIEKYLTWNCTARFALMFNKVWVQMSDEQNCGIGIKCVQMNIIEQQEYKESNNNAYKFNSSLFATSKSSNKQDDNDDDNNSENSDSVNDDSDDDDTDNETDDDSEAESDSDDAPQVKVKSKSSKPKKSAKKTHS